MTTAPALDAVLTSSAAEAPARETYRRMVAGTRVEIEKTSGCLRVWIHPASGKEYLSLSAATMSAAAYQEARDRGMAEAERTVALHIENLRRFYSITEIFRTDATA